MIQLTLFAPGSDEHNKPIYVRRSEIVAIEPLCAYGQVYFTVVLRTGQRYRVLEEPFRIAAIIKYILDPPEEK